MIAVKLFFLILFAIIVIPFLILVLKLVSNAKKSAWNGEVLDKVHNTKEDDGKIENFYFLKVKMSDGQIRNIGLSREMWNGFNKGDKIAKESGQLYPHKA